MRIYLFLCPKIIKGEHIHIFENNFSKYEAFFQLVEALNFKKTYTKPCFINERINLSQYFNKAFQKKFKFYVKPKISLLKVNIM